METFDSSQKGVSSLSRTTTSKADPDTYNMGGDNAEITLFVTLRLQAFSIINAGKLSSTAAEAKIPP